MSNQPNKTLDFSTKLAQRAAWKAELDSAIIAHFLTLTAEDQQVYLLKLEAFAARCHAEKMERAAEDAARGRAKTLPLPALSEG